MDDQTEPIYECVINLGADRIQTIVKKALEEGAHPHCVLDAITRGSQEVGRRFEKGEYYLSDLVMAGETMKLAMEVTGPLLKGEGHVSGRMVLGTIEGDLHDIGKNIVLNLLIAEGLEVFDLGIDVPADKFAEKAKEVAADIVGVSALLSVAAPTVRRVAESLEANNLRGRLKIIAGGATFREEDAERLKIDAAVDDAIKGLAIIRPWAKRP